MFFASGCGLGLAVRRIRLRELPADAGVEDLVLPEAWVFATVGLPYFTAALVPVLL